MMCQKNVNLISSLSQPMDMREQVGIILALPGDGDVIYRTDLAAPNAANEHGVKRSRFKGVR